MLTKSVQKQNLFDKYLQDTMKNLFLYSIWVSNIYVNVKDVLPKPEVRVS